MRKRDHYPKIKRIDNNDFFFIITFLCSPITVVACVELECCGNTIWCEDEGGEIGVDTGDEALDATEREPSFAELCLKSSFSGGGGGGELWTISGLAGGE